VGWAMLTVLQLLTGENWNNVLYTGTATSKCNGEGLMGVPTLITPVHPPQGAKVATLMCVLHVWVVSMHVISSQHACLL